MSSSFTMSFYRYPLFSYRKSVMRGFSVLTDCMERFHILKITKNKFSKDLVGKNVRYGSENTKSPVDIYKEVVEKREKEREEEQARLSKERDREKLIMYEDQCIKDQLNCWKEELKCIPKEDADAMMCLNESVVEDIKETCKRSAKRRLNKEKRVKAKVADCAEVDKIRKILNTCEERSFEKTNKSTKKTNSKKTKKPENNEETPKRPKTPYMLKVDKCVCDQWAKYSKLKERFTKYEQLRLGRVQKCMAAEFLASCKRKTLADICSQYESKKHPACSQKKEGKQERIQLERELECAEREEKACLQHEIEEVKIKGLKKLYKKKCTFPSITQVKKCPQQNQNQNGNQSKIKNNSNANSSKDEERKASYLQKWLDHQRKQKQESLKKMRKIREQQQKCREDVLRKLQSDCLKRNSCVRKEKANPCVLLEKYQEDQGNNRRPFLDVSNECIKKMSKINEQDCREEDFETGKLDCSKKDPCDKEEKDPCDKEEANPCEYILNKVKPLENVCRIREELDEKYKKKDPCVKEEEEKPSPCVERIMELKESLKNMCDSREMIEKCTRKAIQSDSSKKQPADEGGNLSPCIERLMEITETLRRICDLSEEKQKGKKEKSKQIQENACENRKKEEFFDENMNRFRANFIKTLETQDFQRGNKISIIGGRSVGIGCAMAVISKGLSNDLVMYDINNDLCNSEDADLMCGTSFLRNCRIHKSDDVASTKDSRVVVVTTEAPANKDQRSETAQIIKDIMPKLVEESPRAVFIIAAKPTDVMTWLAREITNLPRERCFGTGCHLETTRFRMLIANTLGVSTHAVNGYILGQQGDGSVPIWSTVTVGGTTLHEILPEIGTDQDPMYWSNVHKEVLVASGRVKDGDACSNWTIGLTVADVISAIFEDSYRIMPLSTNANGICGINDDVYFSLPCIVNKWGLYGVVYPQVSFCERSLLRKSAVTLLEAQCGMGKFL